VHGVHRVIRWSTQFETCSEDDANASRWKDLGTTTKPEKDLSMGAFPQSDWLTALEAAAYLKVKARSLLLWVRQGKIQAYALSGTKRRVWRFRQEDLDNFLLAHPVIPSRLPTVLANGGWNEDAST
jgi:excisionase family DNA binding protein